MILTLENFRCFLNKTITIPDEGFILLSGFSGVGKSTICNSILFVLTGQGNKVIHHTKTTCKVILQYQSLLKSNDIYEITRTKRPNKLTLKKGHDIYENETAQELINKKFGDIFISICYLQQGNLNNFMTLSPIEKLNFIEKLAFKDNIIDIDESKKKLKLLVSQRKDDWNKIKNELDYQKRLYNEQNELQKICFPLKYKHKKHIPTLIKNEKVKEKNSTILINKYTKQKNNLVSLSSKIHISKEKLSNLELRLEEYNIEKKEIKEKLNDLNYDKEKLKTLLKNKYLYEKSVEYINLQREIEDKEQEYNQLKEEENEKIEKERKELREQLWLDKSEEETNERIEELKDYIYYLKEFYSTKDVYNSQKEQLENIKNILVNENIFNIIKDIEEKLHNKSIAKQILTCPQCESGLRYEDNKLIYYSKSYNKLDDVDDENELKIKLKKLQKEKKENDKKLFEKENLEKEIKENEEYFKSIEDNYEIIDESDIKDLEEEYKDCKEYIENNKKIEKKLNKKKEESSILSKIYKNILSLKNKLDNLEYNENTENILSLDINEINEDILLEKEKKSEYTTLNSQKEKLKNKINEVIGDIEHIKEKYKEVISHTLYSKDDEYFENNITNLENKINDEEEKREEYRKNNKIIEEYLFYKEENRKRKNNLKEIKEKEEEEKILEHKYTVCNILKEKIVLAESLVIQNVINDLNIRAQVYLEYFFTEEPITVEIKTYKEVKHSKKPQINVEVLYKGMETDIYTLSGGERDRVILAYTLAFAEMYISPIILLDECISSLDQETANKVIEGIKLSFRGKLVLLVGHQLVNGVFDGVISL